MKETFSHKPKLDKKFFWDFDYDQMNWQASYKTVIARTIERGSEQEWIELVKFYGRDMVIAALKKEIIFLPDYAINDASNYFSIDKQEMLSYLRKQSKPNHWI
jgi:hypothetical protein